MNFLACTASDFHDGRNRHSEQTSADAEKQSLNAGQGEWHAKLDGGAFSGNADDVDGALQAIEHGSNYIHAHAASGNLGNFGSSAEAGFENKIGDFGASHLTPFFPVYKAFLTG